MAAGQTLPFLLGLRLLQVVPPRPQFNLLSPRIRAGTLPTFWVMGRGRFTARLHAMRRRREGFVLCAYSHSPGEPHTRQQLQMQQLLPVHGVLDRTHILLQTQESCRNPSILASAPYGAACPLSTAFIFVLDACAESTPSHPNIYQGSAVGYSCRDWLRGRLPPCSEPSSAIRSTSARLLHTVP